MSYNGTDNGYAIFNQVRIPRTNLLMRHSQVSRDGTYTAVPLREKLVYGGMLNGRSISKNLEQVVSFVHDCRKNLWQFMHLLEPFPSLLHKKKILLTPPQ
jgi:hypothetical protein